MCSPSQRVPTWLQAHSSAGQGFDAGAGRGDDVGEGAPANAAAITKSCSNPRAVDGTRDQATPVREHREISDNDRAHFNEMLDFLAAKKVITAKPALNELIVQGYVPATGR